MVAFVAVGRLFFFQAEDGIRDLVRSRGLGDVYKRQVLCDRAAGCGGNAVHLFYGHAGRHRLCAPRVRGYCILYTSDAADERSSVDLGGRRIIKKKKLYHDAYGQYLYMRQRPT